MVIVAIIWAGMGVPLIVIVGCNSWLLIVRCQRSKKRKRRLSQKVIFIICILWQILAIDLWHFTTLVNLPQLWHIMLHCSTNMSLSCVILLSKYSLRTCVHTRKYQFRSNSTLIIYSGTMWMALTLRLFLKSGAHWFSSVRCSGPYRDSNPRPLRFKLCNFRKSYYYTHFNLIKIISYYLTKIVCCCFIKEHLLLGVPCL